MIPSRSVTQREHFGCIKLEYGDTAIIQALTTGWVDRQACIEPLSPEAIAAQQSVLFFEGKNFSTFKKYLDKVEREQFELTKSKR